MRLGHLLLWDLHFQTKYGFYCLYAALTALYVLILWAVPESLRQTAATLLIFSDPAAMGVFFMGAIVLLEKSQHTPCALAVSPVRPEEYVIAKVVSLSAISLVVAAVLGLAAQVDHLPVVLLGTAFASAIFTLLGIVVATQILSLNQFILWTVPVEIVCFVPAILHLLGVTPAWLSFYPINACMDMISGHAPSFLGIGLIVALLLAAFAVSKRCVAKMWRSAGGVSL